MELKLNIVIGTRVSKWAMAATQAVADRISLANSNLNVVIKQLPSPGDLDHGDLAKLGGTTSFVDALSKEVAAGTVDAAVHTVKDISWPAEQKNFPIATVLSSGLRTTGNLLLGAIGQRGDVRDALVFRNGFELDGNKSQPIRIGTGSLLRCAAIKTLLPDRELIISRIRGNIDLRLEELDRGRYDALILSMDGLLAVGQEGRANRIFTVEEMPPAFGQAIGSVEVLESRHDVIAAVKPYHSDETMRCLRAEWATMRALQATCHTPLGGLCSSNNDETLRMFAVMMAADGQKIMAETNKFRGEPEELGIQIADSLISQGASEIERSWIGIAGELSQDAT